MPSDGMVVSIRLCHEKLGWRGQYLRNVANLRRVLWGSGATVGISC